MVQFSMALYSCRMLGKLDDGRLDQRHIQRKSQAFYAVTISGTIIYAAAGDRQFLSKGIFAACKKPGAAWRSAFWVGVV